MTLKTAASLFLFISDHPLVDSDEGKYSWQTTSILGKFTCVKYKCNIKIKKQKRIVRQTMTVFVELVNAA
jgi:hypothetical protein